MILTRAVTEYWQESRKMSKLSILCHDAGRASQRLPIICQKAGQNSCHTLVKTLANTLSRLCQDSVKVKDPVTTLVKARSRLQSVSVLLVATLVKIIVETVNTLTRLSRLCQYIDNTVTTLV